MLWPVIRRVCVNYDETAKEPFFPSTAFAISWGEICPRDSYSPHGKIIDPYLQERLLPNRIILGQMGMRDGKPLIQSGLEFLTIDNLNVDRRKANVLEGFKDEVSYKMEVTAAVRTWMRDYAIKKGEALTQELNRQYCNSYIFLNLAWAQGCLPNDIDEISKKVVHTRR